MSALDEKLAAPLPASDTKARANLTHLRARWGQLLVIEGTEREPRLLELTAMGAPERWRFTRTDDGQRWFVKEDA